MLYLAKSADNPIDRMRWQLFRTLYTDARNRLAYELMEQALTFRMRIPARRAGTRSAKRSEALQPDTGHGPRLQAGRPRLRGPGTQCMERLSAHPSGGMPYRTAGQERGRPEGALRTAGGILRLLQALRPDGMRIGQSVRAGRLLQLRQYAGKGQPLRDPLPERHRQGAGDARLGMDSRRFRGASGPLPGRIPPCHGARAGCLRRRTAPCPTGRGHDGGGARRASGRMRRGHRLRSGRLGPLSRAGGPPEAILRELRDGKSYRIGPHR